MEYPGTPVSNSTALAPFSARPHPYSPLDDGPLPDHRTEGCITTFKGRTIKTPLTKFGRRIRTIVFASLGGGEVCSNTKDWRANLPRFMGMFTNSYVIVYDQRNKDCKTCWANRKRPVPCKEKMDSGIDLLVVIGSGKMESAKKHCARGHTWCPAMHYDLKRVMNKDWSVKARRTVHFPIRNMARLMYNEVFNFDVIIDDGSFPKPINGCGTQMLFKCHSVPKQNKLLYVGRMTEHKGQLKFLKFADPELLKGYTIEMFGDISHNRYISKVKEVAAQKGIQVRIRGEVSKETLFKNTCTAKGMILLSIDKNPRAVYEAVTAGMPVFISKEAQVSPMLTRMPFAVDVSLNSTDEEMNKALQHFVAATDRSWIPEIKEWHQHELTNLAVYKGLCQRMGVCMPGRYKYDPWRNGMRRVKRKMNYLVMRKRPQAAGSFKNRLSWADEVADTSQLSAQGARVRGFVTAGGQQEVPANGGGWDEDVGDEGEEDGGPGNDGDEGDDEQQGGDYEEEDAGIGILDGDGAEGGREVDPDVDVDD